MARQGAGNVHKILSGGKPAELSIEQPSRYEMHIDLATAKALGIRLPPALLARADVVVQ